MASVCRMALRAGLPRFSVSLAQCRPGSLNSLSRASLAFKQPALRARFASAAGLSKADIQARIFQILSGFESVNPEKISETASFDKDLGLDSLDVVEVVMAVEEEFSIEIPDTEADEIHTVQQAIDYIAKTPDAS